MASVEPSSLHTLYAPTNHHDKPFSMVSLEPPPSFLHIPTPTSVTNPSPTATRSVFHLNGKVSAPQIFHYLLAATIADLKTKCVHLRSGFSPLTRDLFSPLRTINLSPHPATRPPAEPPPPSRVTFGKSASSANPLTTWCSVAVSLVSISAPIRPPPKPLVMPLFDYFGY